MASQFLSQINYYSHINSQISKRLFKPLYMLIPKRLAYDKGYMINIYYCGHDNMLIIGEFRPIE